MTATRRLRGEPPVFLDMGEGVRNAVEVADQHRAVQRLLVAHVVVEHRLVDARARRDVVDPRACETDLREDRGGGVKDALLRAVGLSGGVSRLHRLPPTNRSVQPTS